MLGSLSDDVRYDGSDLVRIIESDAPQSQIKFDCILALQGIAGCFGMIQKFQISSTYLLVIRSLLSCSPIPVHTAMLRLTEAKRCSPLL